MDISPLQFLIVCPMVFLAGLVDAVAGGGGLISLPAYLIAGLPVHDAIGTNKISSCMGTGLTTFRYARRGYIPWKQAGFYIAAAFAGASVGVKISLMISDRPFKIIMLILLPLVAFVVLRGRVLDRETEPFSPGKTMAIALASAFVIGVYDGFYGPGTGTFLILLMTGAAHMEIRRANGVTKIINFTTNLTSVFLFAASGNIVPLLGLIAGLFNIAGNYLGGNLFVQGGSRAVKPIMLAVLCIFFVRVLWELAG